MKLYPEYYKHVCGMSGKLSSMIPGTMAGFAQLHKEALGHGALPMKVKKLMALAIAVVVRCDGCISIHIHDALAAGAAREEITEAIAVAILMGGSPSVVYGTTALEALEQCEVEQIA